VNDGVPFDPKSVKAGETVEGTDPRTLTAGRPALIKSRLDAQRSLISQGIVRFTPIVVTTQGIVYDGNHAVRAAADMGVSITVVVVDVPAQGFGSILSLPVT
jgi:hypothetical protein